MDLISELRSYLQPLQKEIEKSIQINDLPVSIIVGSPRSGTTLVTQWLASLGQFSYPSNILTRFAYAPHIGALIEKMLFDPEYDFHGDFHDIQSKLNFQSNLGKSKGAKAVNEFQHFFRNYMENFDPKYLSDDELKAVNTEGIVKGISSIVEVFGKPFVTKAFMLQYNLDYFIKQIPNLFVIYVKRDPICNMQSIYIARETYYKSKEIWLGARPKEYDELKDMDIYHQIAGQVYFTNKAIEKVLKKCAEKQYITIDYELFCQDPKSLFDKLILKYKQNNYVMDNTYNSLEEFNANNDIILPKGIIDNLNLAYKKFELKNEH